MVFDIRQLCRETTSDLFVCYVSTTFSRIACVASANHDDDAHRPTNATGRQHRPPAAHCCHQGSLIPCRICQQVLAVSFPSPSPSRVQAWHRSTSLCDLLPPWLALPLPEAASPQPRLASGLKPARPFPSTKTPPPPGGGEQRGPAPVGSLCRLQGAAVPGLGTRAKSQSMLSACAQIGTTMRRHTHSCRGWSDCSRMVCEC